MGVARPETAVHARGFVVEASVDLEWVVNEPGSEDTAALLDGRPLHAPKLLPAQAANPL
jgi:hypothetical protein